MKRERLAHKARSELSSEATRERSARRVALVLSALAVVAPQLMGGATRRTATVIYVLAVAACAVVVSVLGRRGHRLAATPWVGLGAMVAAVWTLFQAAPLPCSWVRWAQPERRALIHELLALGALQDERCGVSAAPGSTVVMAAQAAVIAAVLLAATATARAGGREVLLRGLAISSIAMAVTSLGHWAINATEVFGFYTPVNAKPRAFLAPLLNENHLAGHLALGWPLCVAMGVAGRTIDRKIVWLLSALAVFVTALLSGSRGGVLALLIGGASFLLIRYLRVRDTNKTLVPALAVVGVSVIIGSFVSYDLLATEFATVETFDQSKLGLVARLMPLLWLHPLTGVGRGALGDVSATVLVANTRVLYTENLPSQWLIEWGIPLTIAVGVAALMSVRGWDLKGSRSTEVALACGLFALLVHNLVDFSLELPGVAIVAAIACGCLASREEPTGVRPTDLRPTMIAAFALATVGLGIAVPWLTVSSKSALRGEVEQGILERSPKAMTALRTALGSYPFEPSFLVLGALAAVRTQDAQAPQWLNLAMTVAPGWAGPNIAAAEFLEGRRALRQAAIELSIAGGKAESPTQELACSFINRHPSSELAWTAAVDQPVDKRLASLEQLYRCIPRDRYPVESENLLAMVAAEYPDNAFALRGLTEAARDRGDLDVALERAQDMYRRLPKDPTALAAVGLLLLRMERGIDALDLLEAAPPALRGTMPVMTLELSTCAELRLTERFDALVEKMLAQPGHSFASRAQVHLAASSGLARRGNYLGALAQAQSAYDLTQAPAELEIVHRAAVQAGVLPLALRTATELCQVRYRGDTYCGADQHRSASPAIHF